MTLLAISAIRHRGCPTLSTVFCRSSLMRPRGSVTRNVKSAIRKPRSSSSAALQPSEEAPQVDCKPKIAITQQLEKRREDHQ